MDLNSFQISPEAVMRHYLEQNAELTNVINELNCDLLLHEINKAHCCILPDNRECDNYVPKTQNGWFTGMKTINWAEEYTTTKTNCCNCGAPLYKNECEYCGTINRG